MAVFASIAVSFGCISLLSFVAVPSAGAPARAEPESDFPFEFSRKKGSVVTADNVLVQSVSADGQTAFETNKSQPIKNYVSAAVNGVYDDDDDDDDGNRGSNGGNNGGGGGGGKNGKYGQPTKVLYTYARPAKQGKPPGSKFATTVYEYHYPVRRESETAAVPSTADTGPQVVADGNQSQWNDILQTLYKYVLPAGATGVRIAYVNN